MERPDRRQIHLYALGGLEATDDKQPDRVETKFLAGERERLDARKLRELFEGLGL